MLLFRLHIAYNTRKGIYMKEDKFKHMTCCFTGHREIPEKDLAGVQARLEQTIIQLYKRGIVYYGAGGALGFDTVAAETVLRLRENYPMLRLILVLPCKDQTRNWKEKDVARYGDILQRANKIVYTGETYTRGCMHTRNRHLVDGSSVCVCYQTKGNGGTAYTVHYAQDHGLHIINVA